MVFQKEFYVGFRNIDENLNLSKSGLLGIFTDIAGAHASSVGDGLVDNDMRWIVVSYEVKVIRPIPAGSDIIVKTWSTGFGSVTGNREFEVRGKSGEKFAYCRSIWVRINAKTKDFVKVDENVREKYSSEPELTNFNTPYKKVYAENLGYLVGMVTADWRWMDINQHMNNTYYLDLIEYCLDGEFKEKFSNFQIDYRKEIVEGIELLCYLKNMDDGVVISITSDNGKIVHAKVFLN